MLEVRSVSKRYGALKALSGVEVNFHPGEVHAVLGENGAGKSTLMGVMAGFVRPDEGTVLLDGEPLPLGDPAACRARGVELVHQHFMLVPAFSVQENLELARLKRPKNNTSFEPIRWEIGEAARTEDLSVGQRQRLEIQKALEANAPVMIFDEPTAVLSNNEVAELFALIRRLRDQGRIVVVIAHKLSEVMEVADRITVLRRGQKVAEALRSEVTERQLAEWMVGELPPARENSRLPSEKPPVLTLEGLQVKGDRGESAVKGVNLQIRPGEVVGIGGVDGNGQVELAEAVAGVRRVESGTRRAPERVGYVPQDRQIDGLALNLSIEENLLIGAYRRQGFAKGPFLLRKQVRQWAEEMVRQFDIRIGRLQDPVGSLSGGNQQKVVVSRTLDAQPDLVVAVNPTRGLDIRSAAFVHGQLLAAAERGAAVLLVSTDLDELFALSDRAFFMVSGQLTAASSAGALVGGSH